MTITLDLPVRRDRWGRYLVLPPEGGKPVGYTRATTVAKALDDQSSLINWRSRMTAVGLAQRPDLLAMVATAGDDKRRLDELCDKAAEHGGATIRRDLGTAIHALLEQRITDPTIHIPQPHRADVEAILTTLDAHGLTVVPGMCEQMIVLDGLKIAGTVDLVVEDRNGRRYIADLKTGASVAFGASSWALQLAIYAHADAIYRQGPAADGTADVRVDMPDVDDSVAYIVHCQPGTGQADLHRLLIGPAWNMVQVALDVRTWRTRKDLLTKINTPAVPPAQPSGTDRAQQLRARARKAVEAWGPEGRREMADCWPEHVPPLTTTGHVWKRKELDDLEELVRGLELRFMALPACYPDGRIVDHHEADTLATLWNKVPAEAREVIDRLGREITPLTVWPEWDHQDGDMPLRERRWRHGCLLAHVAATFDVDLIVPVLTAICDHHQVPANPKLGYRLHALTSPQVASVLEQLDSYGVALDTRDDGTVVATINTNH